MRRWSTRQGASAGRRRAPAAAQPLSATAAPAVRATERSERFMPCLLGAGRERRDGTVGRGVRAPGARGRDVARATRRRGRGRIRRPLRRAGPGAGPRPACVRGGAPPGRRGVDGRARGTRGPARRAPGRGRRRPAPRRTRCRCSPGEGGADPAERGGVGGGGHHALRDVTRAHDQARGAGAGARSAARRRRPAVGRPCWRPRRRCAHVDATGGVVDAVDRQERAAADRRAGVGVVGQAQPDRSSVDAADADLDRRVDAGEDRGADQRGCPGSAGCC